MAGLPPDTIQVKRKRGADEGPVDFLRLERSKRYRSQSGDIAWVYQRKQSAGERPAPADEPSGPAIPTIQPTQEGQDARLRKGSRKPAQPSGSATSGIAATEASTAATASGAQATQEASPLSTPAPDRIRRFHLSRSKSLQLPTAGVSKKRTAPAVFVERDVKKHRESLKAVIQERNLAPAQPAQTTDSSQTATSQAPATQAPAAASATKESNPVKFKRPSTKARPTTTTTAGDKPALPPSLRNREGGDHEDMDELARVMDSWTLAEIAKNLERMEQQSATSKYSPATKSRFRPKAPKQRYFERHPEAAAAKKPPAVPEPAVPAAPGMGMDDAAAGGASTDDDEDYVLETYERVPAERLRDQAVPAHRVGLLVFDTEPDMVEFFYGNESDSEDDYLEDEEDENAENYYTTEYPDEDLDWDDEFDRNAYHYMNQNASDLEEFDERDFIDEVWEKSDTLDELPG
ncbi:hypothetical protein VTK26DRAFT_2994 [Humicola hyalothermophila]